MNLQAVAGVLISLACLTYVLWGQDFAHLWKLARQVNPLYVLGVNVLLAACFWLRSLRWRTLLKPVADCPTGTLMSANLIGFMANNILPARLGELVRIYALDRMVGVPMTSGLATIVVERILDGLTLLLILFATLMFADPQVKAGAFDVAYMRGAGYFLLLAYLGVMAVIGALWRWPQATMGLFTRLLGRLSPGLAAKVGSLLETFHQGLGILGQGKTIPLLIAQSLGVWLPMVGMYWIFLPAVGLPLDLFMGAMAFVGASLAAAVPAAPGYVGPFQLAIVWALMIAGAPEDLATAYAFIYWAAQYFPLVIAGLIELWRKGMSLSGLRGPSGPAQP